MAQPLRAFAALQRIPSSVSTTYFKRLTNTYKPSSKERPEASDLCRRPASHARAHAQAHMSTEYFKGLHTVFLLLLFMRHLSLSPKKEAISSRVALVLTLMLSVIEDSSKPRLCYALVWFCLAGIVGDWERMLTVWRWAVSVLLLFI